MPLRNAVNAVRAIAHIFGAQAPCNCAFIFRQAHLAQGKKIYFIKIATNSLV